MRLICGESISVAVWPIAATTMTAIRKLLFHWRMFPRYRYHFRPWIHQTTLAGDQADEGADQDSPISNPDPTHQREDVGLKDGAFAIVGGAGKIQVQIFIQTPANG